MQLMMSSHVILLCLMTLASFANALPMGGLLSKESVNNRDWSEALGVNHGFSPERSRHNSSPITLHSVHTVHVVPDMYQAHYKGTIDQAARRSSIENLESLSQSHCIYQRPAKYRTLFGAKKVTALPVP